MQPPHEEPAPPSPTIASYGLLAGGRAGQWSIDIDEATCGERAWLEMDIDSPSVYLRFALRSRDVVFQLLKLLQSLPTNDRATEPLVLGEFAGVPVELAPDDEFADRCFLIVFPRNVNTGGGAIRITISGQDLAEFTAAMAQAVDDL